MLALDDVVAVMQNGADPGTTTGRACRDTKAVLDYALAHRDVRLAGNALRTIQDLADRTAPRDAYLDVVATVRAAERMVTLTIRAAQESGKVRRQGDNRDTLPSGWELAGFARKGEAIRCYPLADDVTDAEFSDAITAARADGNLSRAAVLRQIEQVKAGGAGRGDWVPDAADHGPDAAVRRRDLIREYAGQGWSSRQMSQALGTREETIRQIAREMRVEIPADQIVAGTRRGHGPARIAEETVTTLDGLASAVALIDPNDIDPAQAQVWAESLTDSLRVLNRFAKQMGDKAQ
jgi:hypothetical protein